VPHRNGARTDDEEPQARHGPVLPPGEPAGASPADAGPDAISPAGAARSTGPPPRVPARQGPPPKTAPATRPAAVPATRPAAVPATGPGAVPATRQSLPPARRPAAEPSWGTVLATTVRLGLGRRLSKTRWRVLAALLLAALAFGAGAITATLLKNTPAAGDSGTSREGGTAASVPASGSALASVTAVRRQAVSWVARQVNPDEVIGCDPAMCGALVAAGVQASRLLLLEPSQADPLGSEILVDTATLRSQFGPRLESVYAPVSLAAFGSGAARIEVRVLAPGGARAYLAQLAGDLAARRSAGAQMLHNPSIHAAPAARRQLAAGEVDTRLLEMLVTLSSSHPVDIISFGTNQPGASPGVPLRFAEIAGAPGPGRTPAASVRELRRFLVAQQTTYHPSMIAVAQAASRRTVLRVGYPAPSLLGLLGTHG
jgi:hypothetical protein